MNDIHPARRVLEHFVVGRLSPSEMKEVSHHLLAGCHECRQLTTDLFQQIRVPATPSPSSCATGEPNTTPYDGVIDRIYRTVLRREAEAAKERSHAQELYDELLRHPAARQQLLIINSARFRNRMLCEILVDEAHEAGFREPSTSIGLARLAVLIADRLDDNGEVVAGLKARAYAQLGNALRIASDFADAELAFETAVTLLGTESVGLLEIARVLDLEASLRRDQRRFADAMRLMDRVISIYRRLGQRSLLGRALQQKSLICGESGDQESEIALLRRALELLNPDEEPRIFLAARHNLISALCEIGRPRDAFSLLFHTRPLYLRQGDRLNLLRLRWLEGTVALGLQRHEQAGAAFRQVREAFLELGLDYDAALASLDLAEVYAIQGRTGEMRLLANEMLEVFQARSIHREAIGALSVLQQAAEADRAGRVLVREVGSFLRKARQRPDLQFTSPPL
jgi:tetratricopeptide (TPR) repeat protein